MEVSPPSYRLKGRRPEAINLDYAITNRLNRSVSLIVTPSCGCQSVEVVDKVVQPGDTTYVRVAYDPKMLPAVESRRSVVVQVSGPKRAQSFSLSASFDFQK